MVTKTHGWFALAALIVGGTIVPLGCSNSQTTRPAGETISTGKDIRPPAASPTMLGGFPVGLTPSADGKFAIACDAGYRQSLYSISTSDGHLAGRIGFGNLVPTHMQPQNGVDDNSDVQGNLKTNGLYYGVVVSGNTVYAAQGAHESIAVVSLAADGRLSSKVSIPTGGFPAGLAMDGRGLLCVTNNGVAASEDAFASPSSVEIYDPVKRTELGRYTFDSDLHLSNFVLGIVALSNRSKVYCASERDGCVYVIDTTDPTHPAKTAAISTGSHPLAMLLNRDQSRLIVANSQSDTLSLIDTASDQVVGTVLLRPGTSRGVAGVTPVSLSFSSDEKTLFVALADMNAVGVVDVSSLTLTGMIPAGWYPSGVLATDNNQLLVVNAKGTRPRVPNPKNNPLDRKTGKDPYILNLLQGNVESIPVPDAKQLADLTDTVIQDNHLDEASLQNANPLANLGRQAGKIKHVVYVIKENRTYDQILGDDARGNGDASIVLFGKAVTPNQHALADRFVLLDNCYASGETSGDGWVWSTQGMANEYVQRNLPYNYSGRGRRYDFEGENNGYNTAGFPATDPDGKPLSKDPAFKNGAPAVTDVAGMDTHIWDRAREAGLTYRNYGMFLASKTSDPNQSMPALYPTAKGLQPPGHDLAGLTDMDFPNFNLDYPDSDAPKLYFDQTHDANCQYKETVFGKYQSPSRFSEWSREFKQMLEHDPSGDTVPALMLVRLPHDHTQGLASRKHSPASEVADNDFAVGQLVEAISKSPIWESTAIFIIEDDAQNGPDHVDAHRTTAYVVSPWIKGGTVDHRFCNTDTILKTMELLLGMKPMCQYDAIALPLMDWDTTPSNAAPYTAILPAKEVIAQVNPAARRGATQGSANSPSDLAAASDQMDFIHADAAPADRLNEIIWASVKGQATAMPAPKNSLVSPFRTALQAPKDDDD